MDAAMVSDGSPVPTTVREVKPAGRRAPQSPPAATPLPSLELSIEAVLMGSGRPVSAVRLAMAVGLTAGEATEAGADPETDGSTAAAEPAKRSGAATPGQQVRAAIERLNAEYERSGRSFRIEEVAGGWRVMILPAFGSALEAFLGERSRTTLTRAAIETLSIVAYKQPITRARLEAIRGVACGDVLRSLIDRRLVTPVGRAEELGRPILYGTTRRFLETFGLARLGDLPSAEELRVRESASDSASV